MRTYCTSLEDYPVSQVLAVCSRSSRAPELQHRKAQGRYSVAYFTTAKTSTGIGKAGRISQLSNPLIAIPEGGPLPVPLRFDLREPALWIPTHLRWPSKRSPAPAASLLQAPF